MAVTNKVKLKRINKEIDKQKQVLQDLLKEKEIIVENIQKRCDHKNSIMEWDCAHEDEYGSWTNSGVVYRKCQKCALEEEFHYSGSGLGRGFEETDFKKLIVQHRAELVHIHHNVYSQKGWSIWKHFKQFDL